MIQNEGKKKEILKIAAELPRLKSIRGLDSSITFITTQQFSYILIPNFVPLSIQGHTSHQQGANSDSLCHRILCVLYLMTDNFENRDHRLQQTRRGISRKRIESAEGVNNRHFIRMFCASRQVISSEGWSLVCSTREKRGRS